MTDKTVNLPDDLKPAHLHQRSKDYVTQIIDALPLSDSTPLGDRLAVVAALTFLARQTLECQDPRLMPLIMTMVAGLEMASGVEDFDCPADVRAENAAKKAGAH